MVPDTAIVINDEPAIKANLSPEGLVTSERTTAVPIANGTMAPSLSTL